MVQDESMKDNTAAVHVQVPVEVTSFLLNEKRTEITKIELKQRVTVLLVPNKHLETPNYKLERLRQDDPRLEGLQASYTMIEEPSDEVGITRREKSAKPKQEPVIKGVLPDQPAPTPPAGTRARAAAGRAGSAAAGAGCRTRAGRRQRLACLGEAALWHRQPGCGHAGGHAGGAVAEHAGRRRSRRFASR
jgi:ribonuclease E